MKKFLLFSLCSLFLLTTGCMKYSYNIEIDDKDNMVLSQVEAINLSAFKSMNPNFEEDFDEKMEESQEEYEDKGYKVEKYDDGTYSGLKIIQNNNLQLFSKEDLPPGFISKEDMPISIKNGIFLTTYTINLSYNMHDVEKDSPTSVSKDYNNDYNSYGNKNSDNPIADMISSTPGLTPVAELTIKIPKKAIENNATEVVNPNEYKWNLVSKDPVDIYLKYQKVNVFNIAFIIISIILLIVIAVIIRKNYNKSDW